MNCKLLDMNGNTIKNGNKVLIHQYAVSHFQIDKFKNLEEANKYAKILEENLNNTSGEEEYLKLFYRHFGNNEFILHNNDKPYVFEIKSLTFERTAFFIKSEYDTPECSILKGEKVLVFGFEGSAVGVFRYHPYQLKII